MPTLKPHRASVLAGAGVAVGGILVTLLVASVAFAIDWPWRVDKPEVTVEVKGSVVCSNSLSTGGRGASPLRLTITVNNKTETIPYPEELRSDSGVLFSKGKNAYYRQAVTIRRDSDKTTLSYRLECRGTLGDVLSRDGTFDVSRKNLDRTICLTSNSLVNPCWGPKWAQRGGCWAALLLPARAALTVIAAENLKKEDSEGGVFGEMRKRGRSMIGALACFDVKQENRVPAPTTPPAPEPIPAVPTDPIPTVTTVPMPRTSSSKPPTQAPPKPKISNFMVVVYTSEPGHVGVAYDVGWQAGRDPVTCHFFIDGAEVFTAQCGTHSSKQFYGISAGQHSFYATVSDKYGVYSDPSPTVVKTVPGQPVGPRIELSRGGSAPQGWWYSVILSGFGPGSVVTVTCRDSVDAQGFWNQNFPIGGDGRASDSTLCYSADGPDHWVTGGGVESNHVGW